MDNFVAKTAENNEIPKESGDITEPSPNVEEVVEHAIDDRSPEEKKVDEDTEDLYAIKNFSV